MDPGARIVATQSGPMENLRPFDAEIAALAALMQTASEHGAERLRVYTDCDGLVQLWLQARHDSRLDAVRALATRFRRLELRLVPRRHNQSAHRLARKAAFHRL